MKTSQRGLNLVAEFEGLEFESYPDPGTGGHPWTIGFGTTRYPDGSRVQPGDTITEDGAFALLRHDVARFEDDIERLVVVPLNQNQFDALVSFTYNVGPGALERSTLLRKLNTGDYRGAADELPRWDKAGGRVLAGLTRRRKAERELFLTPESVQFHWLDETVRVSRP